VLPVTICDDCKAGRHAHDRFTVQGARIYGVQPGSDAGCPNQGIKGRVDVSCDCTYKNPTVPDGHWCPTCGQTT
jgi:hypothetical protein